MTKKILLLLKRMKQKNKAIKNFGEPVTVFNPVKLRTVHRTEVLRGYLRQNLPKLSGAVMLTYGCGENL